jgi:hypothetical protein
MRSHFSLNHQSLDPQTPSARPMRSHFSPSSRAAMACAVTGAAAMLPAICSAQFSAADYATNSTYAGGWSAGQNGGFGFGPWSFNNGSGSPVQQKMDPGTGFGNALGTAWTLFNPNAAGGDVANAGRSFTPLYVGQRLSLVIDNPTQTLNYRGYTISFNNGTDNYAPGGANVGQQVAAYQFDYFDYGAYRNWHIGDGIGNAVTPLLNTDTAPKGMRLDLTLTSATTYSMTLTPLNGATPYTQSGTLKTGGPIDWLQFQFYNTTENPAAATDFYISSMTIIPEPSTLTFGALGLGGLLFLRRRK